METGEVTFRPACDEDVKLLASTMRAADVVELDACGMTPLEGLLESWRRSTFSFSMFLRGKLAAMGGVWPVELDVTGVWLLTGAPVETYPKAFVRGCRIIRAILLDRYPMLVNVVDARYERALRWAEHLGFEVLPAAPYGPRGLPFHPIRLRRTSWAP